MQSAVEKIVLFFVRMYTIDFQGYDPVLAVMF